MAPNITLEHARDPAKRIFFPRRTRGSDMHDTAKDEGWGRGIIGGPDGAIGRRFDDPVSNGIYTFRPAPAEEASDAELSTIKNTIVVGFKALFMDEDMLGLVGESLRRWNFDRLEYSASSANSGKVATTLSRLKMTAAVRLELPCCIAGVEPVHSEIQPYRWEAGEASNLEAKKATEWLQKHVCPHGVLAVAVTSVAWMRAHWLADGISIKTSKTDILLVTAEQGEKLLERLGSKQPSEGLLIEALIGVLAAYEMKRTQDLKGSIYSIWPQTVAEELALNFMLEHDARIGNRKVPVFGGDFNLHMITHRSAHQSSEIHCAAITKATLDKKQLAVGCMRALLQQGLAAVTAGTGPSSEGPADVAGPSQQQPPDQLRRPEAPPSLETSQPRRPETRGWLKEQGGAAGGAPSKSQYFTAELEEAYSAAMLAMVRRPEWYEAHGRDAPPHSVEHSSLAERLASMNVIR